MAGTNLLLVLFAQIAATSALAGDACAASGDTCLAPQGEAEASGGDDMQSLLQLRGAGSEHQLSPPHVDLDKVLKRGFGKDFRDRQHFRCELPTEECHLGDGEGCDLHGMSFHKVYHVFPGGRTACLDNSSAFFFGVKRGNPLKLLFSLEQGGVCGNRDAFINGFCVTQAYLEPWEGVHNYTNPKNPYHDYTIIRVAYCSGDLHVGNATQPWGDGFDVQLKGYENVNSALQWALGQFPHLKKLALLGSSAGSLGLQIWTQSILTQFSDRKASVVVYSDSFAGITVSPPGVPLNIFQWQLNNEVFMICDLPFLSIKARIACLSANFLWQGHFNETMQNFPDALFASIQSKVDSTQIFFFQTFNPFLTQQEFYILTSLLYGGFATNANFRVYLIDGPEHELITLPWFYTATPLGVDANEGKPTLLKWIKQAEAFGCGHRVAPEVVCLGEKVNLTDGTENLPPGETWCDINCDPAGSSRL